MPKVSTFESFLDQQGIKSKVYSASARRVLAWQIAELIKSQCITKTGMARQIGTSGMQLDRLLDPENGTVHLDTIEKAAKAVGRKVRIELI